MIYTAICVYLCLSVFICVYLCLSVFICVYLCPCLSVSICGKNFHLVLYLNSRDILWRKRLLSQNGRDRLQSYQRVNRPHKAVIDLRNTQWLNEDPVGREALMH